MSGCVVMANEEFLSQNPKNWPENEISPASRRKSDAWKREGMGVTLLGLLALWGGGGGCGIGGGRGGRSGEGAGKRRGNEDVLLTLPSTLRNHIGHGDKSEPALIHNI